LRDKDDDPKFFFNCTKVGIPGRKLCFLNQSICDYFVPMLLAIIIAYFFNYFLRLVVLLTTLSLMCFFIFLFEIFLTFFSSKNIYLCFISCEYDQMNCNPIYIQTVFAYFRMYGFIMVYNMYFTE